MTTRYYCQSINITVGRYEWRFGFVGGAILKWGKIECERPCRQFYSIESSLEGVLLNNNGGGWKEV